MPVNNAPSILSVKPNTLKTYITIIGPPPHKKECVLREKKKRPCHLDRVFFFGHSTSLDM